MTARRSRPRTASPRSSAGRRKDSTGQKLMTFVDGLRGQGRQDLLMKLKAPTGLVLLALGKPSSQRALHDAQARRRDRPQQADLRLHRLGPVHLQAATSGSPATRRSTSRTPSTSRAPEPASGLAGGKVVKVDRVEWRAIPDHQQAVNALLAGEIDYHRAPPHDLLPLAEGRQATSSCVDWNPLGNQYTFRSNQLHKPFDNPKIRQAAAVRLQPEGLPQGVIGDPEYYKVCKALFLVRHAARIRKGHGGHARVRTSRRRRSC